MSAFILSDKHINTILTFANAHNVYVYWRGKAYNAQLVEHLQRMAQIMTNENYKSVNYRYNTHEIPHANVFHFETGATPVQVIKACHSYEYQCCETKDWTSSLAKRINDSILRIATMKLKGYEEAEWSL